MSNELENTNFPFRSTLPFERLERSSELENWAPVPSRDPSGFSQSIPIWGIPDESRSESDRKLGSLNYISAREVNESAA